MRLFIFSCYLHHQAFFFFFLSILYGKWILQDFLSFLGVCRIICSRQLFEEFEDWENILNCFSINGNETEGVTVIRSPWPVYAAFYFNKNIKNACRCKLSVTMEASFLQVSRASNYASIVAHVKNLSYISWSLFYLLWGEQEKCRQASYMPWKCNSDLS